MTMRHLTVDLKTGIWVEGGPITWAEGLKVAASVLPGIGPEEIDEWYSRTVQKEG